MTEKIEVDKEVLFAIAKASDGSLRDAESLLDQLVSFSQDKISLKDVISVLGVVEQEVLFEITDKIIQKDAKDTLGLLNKIIDEGKDASVFVAHLIEHFRNLMIAKVTKADSKLIDLPQEICQRLLQQAQNFSLDEIFSAFNTLVNTQEMSKRLESLRIPLEISLVKLAHDKRGANPNLSNKLGIDTQTAHSTKLEVHPETVPVKDEPDNVVSLNTTSLDNVKGAWQNIIDALSKVKISVATYLNEGSPINLKNNVLTVSFPKNYSLHKESLERKENKAIIEKVVSQIFNADIKVNFILAKEAVEKVEKEEHPFIKSALAAFKARVIREE